jgi:hypothetical protein
MMKWRLFLEGHRFTTINCDGTFEVDVKKVYLNAFVQGESAKHRENVHFIRIGVLHAKSPRKIEMQKDSDGLMIITPPQLNGLRIKQQSFRQCVEQSKWNYLLEKKEEGGKDDDDEDNNDEVDNKGDDDDSDDDNKSTQGHHPPPIKSASTIPSHQESTTIWLSPIWRRLSPIWRSRIHI